MKHNDFTVKVTLWGIPIGSLVWDSERMCSVFTFSEEYLDSKFDISPTKYPKEKIYKRAFYGNKAFEGLPEFLADSLPDDWGNTLFDAWTTNNHIPLNDIRSLMKLSFIGKRGMGALEYVPSIEEEDFDPRIDVNALYEEALNVLHDRQNIQLNPNENITLKKLILLGTSVGGKHAKGLIAINKKGEIRSGQIPLPPDYKYYILKFKETEDVPTSEIELVFQKMATDTGIKMMPSQLYTVSGTNHFLTQRFDRQPGGGKIFTQSLRALSPSANDYINIFWLCDKLHVPADRKETLFRQMVFNFLAGVTDDHSKNFSYTMTPDGKWDLAPAYDVMFTQNTWESPSAASHCLGMWQKRSHVTLTDFIDFGEDLGIENVRQTVFNISDVLTTFKDRCHNIGVDGIWIDRIDAVIQNLLPREIMSVVPEGPTDKTFEEKSMERIRERYPGIQFTGRFQLKSMGKETGLLMHCRYNGKSVSFVLDYEAQEICRCSGLAKKGSFYMKQWKTIDGKPATFSNDRVYSLEFKKRNGIGHP